VPGRCPLTSRTFTSHTTEVRRRPCRTGTARMGLRLRSSLKRGQSRAGGGGTDHGLLARQTAGPWASRRRAAGMATGSPRTETAWPRLPGRR
jgi:hypothetical protein